MTTDAATLPATPAAEAGAGQTPGQSAGETMAFGELAICFDQRVLRPRPWTAEQSRWAAELAASAPEGPLLELCSGAGQIGLLAAALTPRRLVCVDVDPVACEFARHNARAAGLDHRVEVREGRLEEAVHADERFAVVVADPPWVPRTQTGRFPEDPLLAIDGGADGLDVAWACVKVAGRHLVPGGSAVLQIGTPEQVERLRAGLERDVELALTDTRTFERGVLVRLERLETGLGPA
jgi:release factor glutamine methyltransferase